MPCAGDSFPAGFLDTEHIVLLDTARQQCCGFDLRAVFRTTSPQQERRYLVLFQVKRLEPQKIPCDRLSLQC